MATDDKKDATNSSQKRPSGSLTPEQLQRKRAERAEAERQKASDEKVVTAEEAAKERKKEGNTTGQIDDEHDGKGDGTEFEVEETDVRPEPSASGQPKTGRVVPTGTEPVPRRSSMEPGVKTNSGKVLPPRKAYKVSRSDIFVTNPDTGDSEKKSVGEIVYLTEEEARDFADKSTLAPYIGDGDVDVTDGVDEEYETNAVSDDDKNKV